MAPPPEYDKEPKAPDKNVTTTGNDDSKVLYAVVKDQQQNSDHKGTITTVTVEAENNKDVETLDDGQLRALLDEAITYKCPKDREGKSSLFKELLHEVEQDEQACEAARGLSAGRGARRGARGRRELQSNSLQDLVAAMAGEPAPRRPRQPPAQVSARAHHGGSLPSGVDTSFLLSEEPPPGAGYLATVRCVNPPPLAERRVSASDAHAHADVDLLPRRSKPTFPMTYTARATLEIGSGSVCSGRAVTTTTASNQVRTTPVTAPRNPCQSHRDNPDRFDPPLETRNVTAPQVSKGSGQMKLMNAICPKKDEEKLYDDNGGGIHEDATYCSPKGSIDGVPRGQPKRSNSKATNRDKSINQRTASKYDHMNQRWVNSVHNWYESLDGMKPLLSNLMVNRSTSKITEKSMSLPLTNIQDKPESKTNLSVSQSEINRSKEKKNTSVLGNSDRDCLHNQSHTWLSQADMNTKTETDSIQTERKLCTKSNVVYDNKTTEIEILRRKYRERVGYDLIPPTKIPTSPEYFRKTTIEPPSSTLNNSNQLFESTNIANKTNHNNGHTIHDNNENTNFPLVEVNTHDICLHSINEKVRDISKNKSDVEKVSIEKNALEYDSTEIMSVDLKHIHDHHESKTSDSNCMQLQTSSTLIDYCFNHIITKDNEKTTECRLQSKENRNDSEFMANLPSSLTENNDNGVYILETKENLEVKSIESKETHCGVKVAGIDKTIIATSSGLINSANNGILIPESETKVNDIELTEIPLCKQNMDNSNDFLQHLVVQQKFLQNLSNVGSLVSEESNQHGQLITVDKVGDEDNIEIETNSTHESTHKELVPVKDNVVEPKENVKEKFIFAELPNNAYVFLTLPQSFFSNVTTKEIENNNNVTPYTSGENNNVAKRSKTKTKQKRDLPEKNGKNNNNIDKSALKLLLYSNRSEKSLATSGLSVNCNKEVDSAIPFTCITTPEVVASCNTTSSTPQSAVAVDPKPLQLGSCYRAVTSLTGTWTPAAAPAPPAAQPDPAAELQQPRSVISSSFNGLPLSRPNYGSTATTTTDEYKKSLDENGNAVQGFSSPLSGSSQQKKPRRKKSSKNETVIKSHQIDGYQGNKDLNEVLRFIESNADSARTHKPGRAKHKDDSDDKGKKRSSSRRDKESKAKRASSLEELSRTKLEDLTASQPRVPPAKPERRSWGEDARDSFYLREPDAAELTDFQTVTKKRKPRRRADDAAADPPRRQRAPSPRPAPSDRSNDSNDDLDSVHSLPATRAPPAPHASYADIARTRHNIPDLIESCNFYAEGEAREIRTAPPAETDYPALAARRRKPGMPAARAAPRKERAEPPAPDVVADRRPPVVLLDSAARPRDMDGVTFGFDVNEQLLGAPSRRGVGVRCDLLRGTEDGAGAGAVAVPAGGAALRYVPPPLAPHLHHLHRIVDYVGAAWEDVLRCGGGKVRYFSE